MQIHELLTTREAANRLRLSTAALRRLVAMGDLPALRPGAGHRVFRFRVDDLSAYLERVRVAGEGPGLASSQAMADAPTRPAAVA
jgi:excisionase family DNA binding protein